ncbi:MAG: preprotein translocase subunit SecE [Patescibacteria group bacterium]
MANKIVSYIRESRDELKKVVWPSRRETIKYTMLVIGISLGVALYLGAADFGLNIAVEKLITQ